MCDEPSVTDHGGKPSRTEVREYLHCILGFADLLHHHEGLDPRGRRFAGHILQTAQQLLRALLARPGEAD